ncbi:DUF192 domain-containing protein [Anaerobacillus alkaliphilus]|uniref:DUF192 domain-containing protein n=1 Tax=Anaerobacillus alkaliphilus TaxID=1548597 RepID=A0A4Q0VUE8_9BACI|nr:DUF192 domain-containing protein [Anaerobacillus alkaliphilus]
MKLVNGSNGKILAEDLKVADTFLSRLRGLMFTDTLPSNCALHIIPCRSIHSFFMNYAIDVVYLNANMQIVAIDEAVAPGKIGKLHKGTISVVELPAGKVAATETRVGNYLQKIEKGEDLYVKQI